MEDKRERIPAMGEHVVYVDPVGTAIDAVVTMPWGATCVNVAFVSVDKARTDSYGRQIERSTSVMHKNVVPVHGNYWRFPDEEPKETERAAA